MSTVSPPQVVAPEDGQATELSHRVQEALGELAGAAKEGLMASRWPPGWRCCTS